MSTEITQKQKQLNPKTVLSVLSLLVMWAFLYSQNETFWNWTLFSFLGLDSSTRLGQAVHFFFFDSVKILLLLSGITFVVTYIRTYVTIEKTRALLGGRREGVGNVIAASAGIVTPFCSCSAVPVFMGFLSAGVPIGVTLSFLIASPLINEIAVGLLFTLFGWKIAALYLVSGLLIAIVAGMTLGRLKVEKWVEPFVLAKRNGITFSVASESYSTEDRIQIATQEVLSIVKKIWPYLLAGIGIGAVIHGWLPTDFFAQYAGQNNPFAVLIAVLVGIPLYSNAAGVMPIIETLYDKGLPIGTLLAFMMSVVALSLPEMILLKRVLKVQLLATYIAIVGSGIVFVGYIFNAIL